MARPAKWNSATESVRLPKHAIEECLKLAQLLDKQQEESFVQNLEPTLVSVNEERFLIQPEPLTQAELATVDRMYAELMQRIEEAGLKPKEARLLVFSELVKAWGKKLK